MFIAPRIVCRISQLAALSCLLAAGVSTSSRAQTWNLATDISTTLNPTGAWSVGYRTGSTFNLFTQERSDAVFTPEWWAGSSGTPVFVGKNTSGTAQYGIAPGQISLECDYGVPEALWTAPTSGLYNISAVVGGTTSTEGGGTGNASADNTIFQINGVNQSGVWNSGANTYTWTFSLLSLTAGSTVDIFIPQNTGSGNTNTHFTISKFNANSTPEPGGIAMMAGLLSVTGIIAKRRRSYRE